MICGIRHMANWIDTDHIQDYETMGNLEKLVRCNGGPETVTLNSISESPFSGNVVIKLPRSPRLRMATDTGASRFGGT